jgi:DNA repair exonuclease SbcCD ATPase subunit
MHKLNYLKLRNFLLYENQDFDFENGVTRIGGQNRTGKSLLFSGVPPLLYGKTAGSLPVNSSIELGWSFLRKRDTEHVVKIKNNKHSVFKAGADQEPHTIRDARDLIEKAWKIPRDLFYSTVFLSGLRQHPLATGTPQSRADWLASVLDITSVYDDYHLKAQAKLVECKNAKIKHDTISHQLAQLEPPSCKFSEKTYNKAKKDLQEDKKRFKQMSDIDTNYITNLSELVEFLEADPDVSETYDLEAAKLKLNKIAKTNAKHEIIKENQLENQEFLSKISSAKDFLKANPTKRPIDDMLANCESRLEEVKNRNNSLKIKTRITKIKEKLNYIREQQDKLTVKSGTCDVCGSEIDEDHAKKHADDLLSKYQQTEKTLSELQTYYRKEYERETDTIEKIQAQQTLYHKIKRAQTFVKNSTVNFSDNYDEEAHRKSIRAYKTLKKKIETYSTYQSMLKNLPENFGGMSLIKAKKYLKVAKEEASNQKQQREELLSSLDKNTNIIQTYETFKTLESNYTSQSNSLKESLEDTTTHAKDLDAWEALVKSFGNNGLRVNQLQEAAILFGNKLSELSSLLFDDSYKFDINVKPRKLDVLITRKQMTGGLETLSGSESRIWSLVSALALLHVLPSHLRCDTCFLDEIEANLDQKTRDRYTQDFIPELRNVVDKVIIITPLISGEMKLVPDHDYIVESKHIKNSHVSQLIRI